MDKKLREATERLVALNQRLRKEIVEEAERRVCSFMTHTSVDIEAWQISRLTALYSFVSVLVWRMGTRLRASYAADGETVVAIDGGRRVGISLIKEEVVGMSSSSRGRTRPIVATDARRPQ